MEYVCCFCGDHIAHVKPDVAGLMFTTCVDREKEFQLHQPMWCHTKCLKERLHPKVILYVLDMLEWDGKLSD